MAKTDEFMAVANICMEALMEKYFDKDVDDNTLFIAFSDGNNVDCAIAGKGINIVNTLCSCCRDNKAVLLILRKVVKTMNEAEDIKELLRFLRDNIGKIEDDTDE